MTVKTAGRIAAAALTLNIAAAGGLMAFADDMGSCEIRIPVTVTDGSGRLPEGTVFKVEITGEDGAPMPLRTLYEVDVGGSFEFGPILFDEPESYEYIIREQKYDDADVITDETVYHLHAITLLGDDGKLIGSYSLTKEQSEEKPVKLEFVNDYAIPPPQPPDDSSTAGQDPEDSSGTDESGPPGRRTGDSDEQGDDSDPGGGKINPGTGTAIGLGAAVFAVPLLAVFLSGRKRGREEEDPPDERSG